MSVEWNCPVHGWGRAEAMGDAGVYCLAEDPARPEGVCGRDVTGKLRIVGEDGEPRRGWEDRPVNPVAPPRPKEPKAGRRRPGSARCSACERDMAGEHSRALMCTGCRAERDAERERKKAAGPARAPKGRATPDVATATRDVAEPPPEPDMTPDVAPATPNVAAPAAAGSLLDRVTALEVVVGGIACMELAELLARVEALEKLVGVPAVSS